MTHVMELSVTFHWLRDALRCHTYISRLDTE
jgi:hypothetical protein